MGSKPRKFRSALINIVSNKKTHVSLDSHQNLSLVGNQSILIKKHDSELTLIHPEDHDFYSGCRNKLGWSSGFTKK